MLKQCILKSLCHVVMLFLFTAILPNSYAQPGLLYNWAQSPQNTQLQGGSSTALAMKADAAGNMYVGGVFQGTADFDPGPGVANFSSFRGGGDVGNNLFFAKYDAAGNYLFARTAFTSEITDLYGILVDGSSNIYITGTFNGSVDFDLDTTAGHVAMLTSAGGREIYLAKYDANGNYLFAKRMGGTGEDYVWSMIWDNAGNILIDGAFEGTADFDPHPVNTANLISGGSYNSFFAKYDANGNYIYAKSMRSTVSNSNTRGMATDAANNVYITGAFRGTVDFNPDAVDETNLISTGITDIFLAKYAPDGSLVFANRLGGGSAAFATGWSLYIDGSGNPMMAGSFSDVVDFDPDPLVSNNLTSAGGTDIFISKYTPTGNFIYARQIGALQSEDVRSVTAGPGGTFYISGSYSSTIDFNPDPLVTNYITTNGSADNYLGKFDDNGNYLFVSTIGGSSNEYNYAVTTGGSGNVYIAGNFLNTANFNSAGPPATLYTPGPSNAYFAKYNGTNGAYIFAGAIGGYTSTALDDRATGVALDAAGNVFATGSFKGTIDLDTSPANALFTSAGDKDIFISKYNSNGGFIKAISIGGSSEEEGKFIKTDAAGNVYVIGSFLETIDFDPGLPDVSLSSTGALDIFIAKYDNNLNFIFAKSIGGSNSDICNGACLDAAGNIYLTGYFQGTADFNPAAATVNLVSAGGIDIFFAKYDVNGNYIFAKRLGGAGSDNGTALVAGTGGSIYLTGSFFGTVDFNPDAGLNELTAAGNEDIFLAKYDGSGNYVFAKKMGGMFSDESKYIALDATGNVWVTGNFQEIADFNPDDAITDNLQTMSGGEDIFLAKYDANGNYLLAKSITGPGSTGTKVPADLKLDNSANVYLAGGFSGTVDFDPDVTATANLTSQGYGAAFAAVYDNDGNYIFAQSLQGLGFISVNAVSLDLLGNAYLAGEFNSYADLDPSPSSTAAITSLNAKNLFLAKYGVGLIIPLRLLNFTAELKSSIVYLKWATAFEQNTSHFVIERSSDGANFTDVASITAVGNSNYRRDYFTTDNLDNAVLLRLPVIYYRLRMVDKDGLITYSAMQKVKPGYSSPAVILAGNPVKKDAVLLYDNAFSDYMNIRVLNVNGSVIMVLKMPVNTGKNQLSFSTEMLSAGLYFIEAMLDDKKTTIRMLKK